MSEHTHQIRRQVLEIEVADEAEGRRLQGALSRLQERQITPLIERVCDLIAGDATIVRLDRVTIDLGEIDGDRFEESIVDALSRALPEALQRAIRGGEDHRERASSPRIDGPLAACEELDHFARSGALPWWSRADGPDHLRQRVDELLRHSPAALTGALRRLVDDHDNGDDGDALERLAAYFDDATLAALVDALAGSTRLSPRGHAGGAREIAQTVMALVDDPAALADLTPRRRRSLVWQGLLRAAARLERAGPAAALHEAVLDEITRASGHGLAGVVAALDRRDADARGDGATPRSTSREPEPVAARPVAAATTSPPRSAAPGHEHESGVDASDAWEAAAAGDASAPEAAAIALRRALATLVARRRPEPGPRAPTRDPTLAASTPSTPSHPPSRPRARERPPEDELHVDDAGAVILGPFLPHFFARLGLLADRRFHDPPARARAATILRAAVHGDAAVAEYQLPLAKILCGLEPDALIDPDPPITDAEAAESVAMLEAVIERAAILQKMSVDGLRGTFLLRPGILSVRDGAWLLRVERRAFDLVLDRFPWSFSWVKLPWMAAAMQVEW